MNRSEGSSADLGWARDPTRWFGRLASIAAAELPGALDAIAARVHELFPSADLVVVDVVDETEPGTLVHGYSLGQGEGAAALAPLLTPDGLEPIGLAEAAREGGETVVWAGPGSAPVDTARVARRVTAPILDRLIREASGVAVPLGTPFQPRHGAVALISVGAAGRLPAGAAQELEALAPQIAMAARNHQLAARSRHIRRTLEAVISSSPMGVLVSDLRGRLSLANRAASQMLDLDLGPLIGQRMRDLVRDRLKWLFEDPAGYERRALAIYGDRSRVAAYEAETVAGRAIEHSSSPVRDVSGALLGRVDILHDVTEARSALAEAQRLATERAELLEREERRAQEEVALSRAAHMMASALTPADIHQHLLDQAHQLAPACDKSAVLIVDRRGVVQPAATRGFGEETVRRMLFRSDESVIGRVMTTQRPFICNDTELDGRVSSRITRPEGIRSFLHVPLVVADRPYGLLSVNSAEPNAFGERDLRVLTELSHHAAAALQNALQFEQERHVAETLQEALLVQRLPEVEGLELAALYEASAGFQVGGDFYDAWELPDGRLVLLVGDVSGRGIEAAGRTAMVRYMAEALGRRHQDPAALVSELNDLMSPRLPDGSLVTLVLAVIDPRGGTLSWCSAGHPAPVLLGADGSLRALDDPDPPCGAFPGHRFSGHSEPFGEGDLLFLYTDGLTEARRQGRELGEEGLHETIAAAADQEPEALANAVYAAVSEWSDTRLSDDVAIAIVKRTAAGSPAPALNGGRGGGVAGPTG